ncbi:MAG: hypothetical protein Q7S00_01420, partial [bacterium]|nr:hypothetical protein [bacterium]
MVVIKGHGPFRGIFDGGKSTTTPSSISKPDFAKVLSKEQAVSGLRAVEQGTTQKPTGLTAKLMEDPG